MTDSRSQPIIGHTPTPWGCRGQQVIDTSEHAVSIAYCGMVAGAGVCKDGKIRSFGINQETANANAAFIVEAVNSHAALVKALEDLREEIVVGISFLNRDSCTARLQPTADSLIKRFVKADAAALAVLSSHRSTKT